MIKTLFRIQVMGVYNTLIIRQSGKKKKKNPVMKLLFLLLAVYVIGALFVSEGVMFYQIAAGLIPAGLSWVYFAYAGVMGMGASVLLNIFTSQSLLFEAHDNELLLSLPLKPGHILGSRILVLAMVNTGILAIVEVPASAIYIYFAKPVFWFYPVFLISFLLIMLLSAALSCVFGYIVAAVTGRMRNKSLFTTGVSLALTCVYLWIYMQVTMNANALVTAGADVGEALRKSMPPFYYFGNALACLEPLSLFLLSLWCVLPFAAVYMLLSKNFIKLVTTKRQAKKLEYHTERMEQSSVFQTLLQKELYRFTHSSIYLLNCGLGFLLQIVFGVFFFIKGPSLMKELFDVTVDITSLIIPIAVASLCCIASVGSMTAPSISLEGKSLWILKSSPVKVSSIFNAKIGLQVFLGVASILIADAFILLTLKPGVNSGAVLILLPVCVQIFNALTGLVCNLYFPKFDYTNETAVVKQSASVMVSMLVSFAVLGIGIMLYVFVFEKMVGFTVFGYGAIIVLILLNVAIYRFIMTKGVDMFNRF